MTVKSSITRFICMPLMCAVAVPVIMATGSAQAGFQWTAPAVSAAPAAAAGVPQGTGLLPAPAVAASPTTPVTPAPLPPMVKNNPVTSPVTGNKQFYYPPSGTAPQPADIVMPNPMPNTPVAAAPSQMQAPRPPVATPAPVMADASNLPAPSLMPQAPVGNGPVPLTGQSNIPVQNAAPANQVTWLPAPAAPAVMGTPASAPAVAPALNTGMGFAVAQGFGKDLPLVMAIRQIVPDAFGFVFDDSIDLGTRVSWQGGRPWNQVLDETLGGLGLKAAIRGNVVSIGRMGTAAAQMPISSDDMSAAGFEPAAYAPAGLTPLPTTSVGPASGGFINASAGTAMPMNAPAAPLGAAQAPQASGAAMVSNWTAARGTSLRDVLETWSQRAGVDLYWSSEYDFPLLSAVTIQGTFEEAVQTLLRGFSDSKPRPTGRLHPNLPSGPAVLVIETRGNSL